MPDHTLLFSPLRLGAHTVQNRIVSTAHGEHMGASGRIPEELVNYHARRAEGGVGLMTVFGSGTVHPDSDNAGNISLWDAENEPRLYDLASRVRSHGTVLLAQATHRGPREKPSSPDAWTAGPSFTPGPLPHGSPHVLTAHDIDDIVSRYGAAAARLARCGFSGVEITGLGSHLMELFWSPAINRRDDHYGGSFENRMRLTRDIIAEVTRSVPADFLLAFRISLDPQSASLGMTTDDMLEVVEHIDHLGRVDLFSISGGSGANIETHAGNVPTEVYASPTYAHLGAAVKAITRTPVIVAGRILTGEAAEQILSDGSADLVAMTRALIADPDLPRRLRDGQEELARPCIAINEGCRKVVSGGRLACTVNPVISTPSLEHMVPAVPGRRVAIIGGGPAGLEAARTAAQRGHEVTVFEKTEVLGGQVLIAALDPARPNLRRHVDWCTRELERLGVTVRSGIEVDAGALTGSGFDVIIVATGSRPVPPPGLEGSAPTTMTDVELWTVAVPNLSGRTVTVFDAQGHRRGAAAAVRLALHSSARVRLATPYLEPMAALENPNKPPFLREMTSLGIEVLTSHELHTDGAARLVHMWSDEIVPLREEDVLVSVGWADVDNTLSETVRERMPQVAQYTIGDAVAPRLLRNAISEGVKAGARI